MKPKTLAEVTARNPFPSWAREISDDVASGLNVAALRARSANASAIAPFDVIFQAADGTEFPLTLVDIAVCPTAMKLIVRLPKVARPQQAAAG